jgi:hypothetical protein
VASYYRFFFFFFAIYNFNSFIELYFIQHTVHLL